MGSEGIISLTFINHQKMKSVGKLAEEKDVKVRRKWENAEQMENREESEMNENFLLILKVISSLWLASVTIVIYNTNINTSGVIF